MIENLDFRWLQFNYTQVWWLLLLFPVLLALLMTIIRERKKKNKILFSTLPLKTGNGNLIRIVLHILRYTSIAFIVIAMTRPQMLSEQKVITHYSGGIDILISLDISGSMLSEDFDPNRLEVAKKVAKDFIRGRKADRIGLVAYEGHAITKCPLTTDHNLINFQLDQLESGMISDGTAIGTGLAVAVNRLRESNSKSKVIILLTDGMNNAGNVDPVTAAGLAKEFGIRVYSIGIGSHGEALMPHRDPFGRMIKSSFPVDIDEESLKSVSAITGGKYFRATDENSLRAIYAEIDKLEKSEVSVKEYKSDPPEKFHSFVFLACILTGMEFILRSVVFRNIF